MAIIEQPNTFTNNDKDNKYVSETISKTTDLLAYIKRKRVRLAENKANGGNVTKLNKTDEAILSEVKKVQEISMLLDGSVSIQENDSLALKQAIKSRLNFLENAMSYAKADEEKILAYNRYHRTNEIKEAKSKGEDVVLPPRTSEENKILELAKKNATKQYNSIKAKALRIHTKVNSESENTELSDIIARVKKENTKSPEVGFKTKLESALLAAVSSVAIIGAIHLGVSNVMAQNGASQDIRSTNTNLITRVTQSATNVVKKVGGMFTAEDKKENKAQPQTPDELLAQAKADNQKAIEILEKARSEADSKVDVQADVANVEAGTAHVTAKDATVTADTILAEAGTIIIIEQSNKPQESSSENTIVSKASNLGGKLSNRLITMGASTLSLYQGADKFALAVGVETDPMTGPNAPRHKTTGTAFIPLGDNENGPQAFVGTSQINSDSDINGSVHAGVQSSIKEIDDNLYGHGYIAAELADNGNVRAEIGGQVEYTFEDKGRPDNVYASIVLEGGQPINFFNNSLTKETYEQTIYTNQTFQAPDVINIIEEDDGFTSITNQGEIVTIAVPSGTETVTREVEKAANDFMYAGVSVKAGAQFDLINYKDYSSDIDFYAKAKWLTTDNKEQYSAAAVGAAINLKPEDSKWVVDLFGEYRFHEDYYTGNNANRVSLDATNEGEFMMGFQAGFKF